MIDIVYSDGEISIALNKIQSTVELLAKTMEEYHNSLANLQGNGIKDDLICGKLTQLANNVKRAKRLLLANYDEIEGKLKQSMQDIEDADNFIFPGDFSAEVLSILSSILG